MPILFSNLLRDDTFKVKNRKDIRALYDTVKIAVNKEELTLEGHTLPTTMNAWIARVESTKKLPKRDVDVVDFSLADDAKFINWKKAYLEQLEDATVRDVYVSQAARDLLEPVHALQEAYSASMARTNNTKDDVLSALSDLQAAAYLLIDSYDRVQPQLRLAPRNVPLRKVKVRKSRPKASAKKADAPTLDKKAAPKRKVKKSAKPAATQQAAQPR